MNITILGASGFIGKALTKTLIEDGHSLTALDIAPDHARKALPESVTVLQWSLDHKETWKEAAQTADVVINLAGAPLFSQRWTNDYKNILRDSRISTTQALVSALIRKHVPHAALINASAMGYYGDTNGKAVDESAPAGHDFLANLCTDWEAEALKAASHGVRVVCIRSAIVLGKRGGILGTLLPLFNVGLGGPLGSGKQHIPWVHIDDEVGIIRLAVVNNKISGPLNSVAPEMVTFDQFAHELGRALHRPTFMHVPEFVLRLFIGEAAAPVVTNQKIVPKVAQHHHYQWKYPALQQALSSVFKS